MKKIFFTVLPILAIMLLMLTTWIFSVKNEKNVPIEQTTISDHKDVALRIDGKEVALDDGYAEVEVAPGSASKIITRYFGNELITDLNGDGRDDVAFVVTQDTGGSGVFFYAVGAVATDDGYVGTDGFLLGDRIAPQSTNVSPNPRHKNVVVFNYADRLPDEPMTTQPSLGKSAYLKLDVENMMWGVVEPNFEGEGTISDTSVEFRYPDFSYRYISAVAWPPSIVRTSDVYDCRTGKEKVIAGEEYCVITTNEGAAGSTYTTYLYKKEGLRVEFTLRFPQCLNFDEPQRSECQQEQALDVDALVGDILSTVKTI